MDQKSAKTNIDNCTCMQFNPNLNYTSPKLM